MGHLVAVDLETSGLDPEVHEIIEVGMVFWVNVQNSKLRYIKPVTFSLEFNEKKADPKALEVNGWGVREFPKPFSKLEAAVVLSEVLDDAHMIIKNPVFDASFLKQWFKNTGYNQPKWHHRMVDIGSLVQGRFRLRDPMNTEAVVQTTGIELPDRHTALADAKWNWDVFHYIMKS